PGRRSRAFQELGHLFAFAQLYNRLLPVRSPAGETALPLHLAVSDAGSDGLDLGAEQLLDGVFDVDFIRVPRDMEDDRPAILPLDRGLFGDERPANDVCKPHIESLDRWSISLHPSACC